MLNACWGVTLEHDMKLFRLFAFTNFHPFLDIEILKKISNKLHAIKFYDLIIILFGCLFKNLLLRESSQIQLV